MRFFASTYALLTCFALVACAGTSDRAGTLERLVASNPNPDYWHELLQLARNEKGLNDEQVMDIFRLRLAVGDLQTDVDYQDAAMQALIVGSPLEAKAVMDKGFASRAVQSGQRVARLMNKIEADRVFAEAAIRDLATNAATNPNASVKLGLIYWTAGKGKESEEAVRNGMKGKLTDPEGAKVALGHALLAQGKKREAIQAFNSVSRDSKEAPIARLWAIYARRA